MSGPQAYARNAAAMWASLAPWARPVPSLPQVAVTEVPAQALIRVIALRPLARDPGGQVGALLAAPPEGGRVVVEDAFGCLALAPASQVTVERLPVMVRPPGPASPAVGPGVAAGQVRTPAALALAERVIVEGFPKRSLLPYRPGRALPPLVLGAAGWRVWLACRDGQPAAACCTFDDGAGVGLYWVATLPAHRSHGLARAVVTTALAAVGDRPAALAATAAGRPLYESLGFATVAMATWHRAMGRRE